MNCKNTACPLVGISLIPLTQGKYAIVNTDDYDWLMQWKWQAIKATHTYYARRSSPRSRYNGKQEHFLMHRVLLNVPQDMETDHRNHNGLDNRRQTIRICTREQNLYNQKPPTGCASKYKGVSRSRANWRAYIYHRNKKINIGSYQSEEEAAKAYDAKAIKLFGEFACTNFRK